MSTLDFWNLAGRAGRLNEELFGNIFCIKEDSKSWKNTDLLKLNMDIRLKTNPIIEVDKKLKDIELILKDKTIKLNTIKEEEILQYLANIICIDTLELKANYHSPVIQKLIDENKEKIIEFAKIRMEKVTVPKKVLNSNQSIMAYNQQKVYNYLQKNKNNLSEIKLPQNVSYQTCLEVLQKLHTLYEWEKNERVLSDIKSMQYFAFLMNSWINGFNLKQIIVNTLEYNENNNRNIRTFVNNKPVFEKFDKNNVVHINRKINELIGDIEGILRYSLEKYFNHYHLLLVDTIGDEKAGLNWANYLEYGTRNLSVVALQNIGFSRHVALLIMDKYKGLLQIENGKLVGVPKDLLIKVMEKGSIEFEEVHDIL